MKKLLPLLFCVIIFANACTKKRCAYNASTKVATTAEITALKQHLDSKGIVATQAASGLFYKIIEAGTGTETPTLCDAVNVAYKGTLLDGTSFDSSEGVTFELGRLIDAWQKAIPLIKKGGKIEIYAPASLAYGASGVPAVNGSVAIPPYSPLYFEIQLLDIN